MRNFTYQNRTEMIFGKDVENNVGQKLKGLAKKVLIHYGGGSVVASGLLDRIKESLNQAGVAYVELGGVKPNPKIGLVREGVALCREESVDFILAVGGGSVIDSAKAIGIGFYHEGDVWDYFIQKVSVKETLPVGVVLTIPAAGSESSNGCVITNEENEYKRSAGSKIMRPVFAFLNPELTYTLPPYQTACGIVDMFAHVLERYFTNEKGVNLTDRLCEATLKTIVEQGLAVMANPLDYNARAEIMWAGAIAHNGSLGLGRSEDWGSHMIEHEISGIYDIAHGAGLAIVFPAWMQYVHQHDLGRFVQYAEMVWGIPTEGRDEDAVARAAIEATKRFFKQLGMPISFEDGNLPTDKIEEMAEKTVENGPVGSFIKLDKGDVIRILKIAADLK